MKNLMSYHFKIKPLSVNDVWKGKRYRTDKYDSYDFKLSSILPEEIKIPDGKIQINIHFGFSSKASDIDNPIKPLLDILQKKYSFNDNRIYKMSVLKSIVKKGDEFIKFSMDEYRD